MSSVNHGIHITNEDKITARHHADALRTTSSKSKRSNGTSNTTAVSATGFQERFDPITYKKQQARKQVGHILSKAFSNEKLVDQQLQQLRDQAGSFRSKAEDNYRLIQENTSRIEDLRVKHEVDPDSQEQKDLEFLQEYDRKRYFRESISEDEKQRVAELSEQGLTEYQESARTLSAHNLEFTRVRNEALQKADMIDGNVRQAEIDRLGSQGIQNAVQQADELEKAANKEILGMLIQEGKDQVDEDTEKVKEQQKKLKDEKEEQEEKLEAAKEIREEAEARVEAERLRKKENEELTEQMAQASLDMQPETQVDSQQDQAQREINLVLQKASLLPEDVKGLKIDDTIF